MPRKLSDAQARVLQELAKEGVVIEASMYWARIGEQVVKMQTFWALSDRGYIDDRPSALSMGRYWHITDAGREALKAWEGRC